MTAVVKNRRSKRRGDRQKSADFNAASTPGEAQTPRPHVTSGQGRWLGRGQHRPCAAHGRDRHRRLGTGNDETATITGIIDLKGLVIGRRQQATHPLGAWLIGLKMRRS